MNRYLKGAVFILIAFSIGLVGFYMFSAMHGDGLEKTMDDNGVSEGEQTYHAPLDYGDDYSSTLVMGVLGFLIVLAAMTAYVLVVRSRKDRKSN